MRVGPDLRLGVRDMTHRRRMGLVLGVGMLLAACAPALTAGPTAVPPPTQAPPKASAPTPAPAATAVPPAAAASRPTLAPQPTVAGPSFAGQTIRLIVGYGPGGGYDSTARVLAQYLGKYLLGAPTVIVENMPGAGSMVAANYLYNTAPKDGTAIATFNAQIITSQAMGEDGIQFDARKFNWLASAFTSTDVCVVSSATPVMSYKELIGRSTPITMAGTQVGDNQTNSPLVLAATTGAAFKVVTGYKGSQESLLAVERGEVQGQCGSWESMSRTSQYETKMIRVLVQNSAQPIADLPDVPTAEQFATDEAATRLLRMYRTPRQIDKPYAVPPGTPADRVQALRTAFDSTFKDPAFLQAAQAAKLDLAPKGGAQVTEEVTAILGLPADLIQRYKQIIEQ